MVETLIEFTPRNKSKNELKRLRDSEAALAKRLRITIETQSALLQKLLARDNLNIDLANALEDAANQYLELSNLISTRHNTLQEIEVLANERDACAGTVEQLIKRSVRTGSGGTK